MKKKSLLPMLLIFVGFVGLYMATRSTIHTFDALSYTQDVENKPFIELYHPHHLLYGVVGRWALRLAELFGYSGRADVPIQWLNALAGAAGVVLLWRFGVVFSGRRWLSLAPSLLMGVAYAFWLYATEVEVYTFAALFIVLSLWLLAKLPDHPRPVHGLGLALAGAGAVMFHQTNLFFVFPMSLFLAVHPTARRLLPFYAGGLALAVGLPYLLVGWWSGFRTLAQFYGWLTDYAQQGTWGGYLSLDHLPALRDGLLDTVSTASALAWVFYALALLGVVLGRLPRPWAFLVAGWLVLYGAFFWWWEPWNIEFWLVLLPLFALGILAGLRHDRAAKPISAAAGVLALLLLLQHLPTLRQNTNPQNDYYRQLAETLQAHLAPTDLVVTRGNILDLYLPFYADFPAAQVLSRRQQADLLEPLQHAHRRGQVIYIDHLLLDEPQDPQRNPFGLNAEEIAALWAAFPIQEKVAYAGQNVFYSIGERAAPTATRWRFDAHLGGWLEFGANAPRFEGGGWCITGGGDPWLESPPLTLDAARFMTLQIDLSIDQPADYGQFFWRRAGEGLDEARSLRFPLEVGRNTYTLSLAGREGWAGEIVFLRFDPIPENLTVNACVFSLVFGDG